MTRSEMIDAVKRVFDMEESEEEIDVLVSRLKSEVPHAKISDMIFWPDVERTPEQIVDEALRRQRTYGAGNATKA